MTSPLIGSTSSSKTSNELSDQSIDLTVSHKGNLAGREVTPDTNNESQTASNITAEKTKQTAETQIQDSKAPEFTNPIQFAMSSIWSFFQPDTSTSQTDNSVITETIEETHVSDSKASESTSTIPFSLSHIWSFLESVTSTYTYELTALTTEKRTEKLAHLLEISDKIGEFGATTHYRNSPIALYNFKSALKQFASGCNLFDDLNDKKADSKAQFGGAQPKTVGETFLHALATENKPHGGIAAIIDLKNEYKHDDKNHTELLNEIIPALEEAVGYLKANFINEINAYSKNLTSLKTIKEAEKEPLFKIEDIKDGNADSQEVVEATSETAESKITEEQPNVCRADKLDSLKEFSTRIAELGHLPDDGYGIGSSLILRNFQTSLMQFAKAGKLSDILKSTKNDIQNETVGKTLADALETTSGIQKIINQKGSLEISDDGFLADVLAPLLEDTIAYLRTNFSDEISAFIESSKS